MSNMLDPKERQLEALLKSRGIEPASPDLKERIIRKAQQIPQTQTISIAQWVKGLFAEFRLPRPAYVLVSTLIFGFIVGSVLPQSTVQQDDRDPLLVQSVLYGDEDLL